MNLGGDLYPEFKMENKQRQIAYKIRISDILNGEYIKEEGWLPNYVIVNDKNVSRANLIGVVVAKTETDEQTEVLIDDNTGRVSVRSFNDATIFEKINVGNVVLLIGRPREYGGEKYIVPEIIKEVKKNWFDLRLIELDAVQKKMKGDKLQIQKEEEKIIEQIVKSKINSEDVLNLIKRFDDGDGANYEELVEKLGDEKVIKTLLEEGEIFEVTPGRLKAL